MALVNRISRLFTADFHAVLDRIEEPEQLLKQAIRDMEDELVAAEQRIRVCSHEQDGIVIRKTELSEKLREIEGELDLCFGSKKHSLARSLMFVFRDPVTGLGSMLRPLQTPPSFASRRHSLLLPPAMIQSPAHWRQLRRLHRQWQATQVLR